MSRINLDLIEVPNPCTVPWDSMQGDDRIRHCSQCQQNVYHLSKMSREEAEALILQKEGKLCVQFYRRADGSVVTRNCAVVRAWRGLVSGMTVAVLGLLALVGLSYGMQAGSANSTFSFVGGGMCPPRGGWSGGQSSNSATPSTDCPTDPTKPEVAPSPHEPVPRDNP